MRSPAAGAELFELEARPPLSRLSVLCQLEMTLRF